MRLYRQFTSQATPSQISHHTATNLFLLPLRTRVTLVQYFRIHLIRTVRRQFNQARVGVHMPRELQQVSNRIRRFRLLGRVRTPVNTPTLLRRHTSLTCFCRQLPHEYRLIRLVRMTFNQYHTNRRFFSARVAPSLSRFVYLNVRLNSRQVIHHGTIGTSHTRTRFDHFANRRIVGINKQRILTHVAISLPTVINLHHRALANFTR